MDPGTEQFPRTEPVTHRRWSPYGSGCISCYWAVALMGHFPGQSQGYQRGYQWGYQWARDTAGESGAEYCLRIRSYRCNSLTHTDGCSRLAA